MFLKKILITIVSLFSFIFLFNLNINASDNNIVTTDYEVTDIIVDLDTSFIINNNIYDNLYYLVNNQQYIDFSDFYFYIENIGIIEILSFTILDDNLEDPLLYEFSTENGDILFLVSENDVASNFSEYISVGDYLHIGIKEYKPFGFLNEFFDFVNAPFQTILEHLEIVDNSFSLGLGQVQFFEVTIGQFSYWSFSFLIVFLIFRFIYRLLRKLMRAIFGGERK